MSQNAVRLRLGRGGGAGLATTGHVLVNGEPRGKLPNAAPVHGSPIDSAEACSVGEHRLRRVPVRAYDRRRAHLLSVIADEPSAWSDATCRLGRISRLPRGTAHADPRWLWTAAPPPTSS